MEDKKCIFCSPEQIKAHQIYETKLFRILIDKKPIAPGHSLIVTKRHTPSFSYLTPDEVEEFAYLIKKLGLALMRAVRAGGYNVLFNEGLAAGQTINHFHVHVIPRQQETAGINPKDVLAEALQARKELTPEEVKEARKKLSREIY